MGCGCEKRAAVLSAMLRGLAGRMDTHKGRTLAQLLAGGAVVVLGAGAVGYWLARRGAHIPAPAGARWLAPFLTGPPAEDITYAEDV